MRILVFSFVASLSLLIAGAAIADPTDTSAAAAAAGPEPMVQSSVPTSLHTDPGTSTTQVAAKTGEKLICHHPVHEGTVLPQDICLTQHDWDRIRMREQKNVTDWQMHGYQAAVH